MRATVLFDARAALSLRRGGAGHEIDPMKQSKSQTAWRTAARYAELAQEADDELERAAIKKALERAGGNRKKAAEQLGIGLRTLYEKLKRYGIR